LPVHNFQSRHPQFLIWYIASKYTAIGVDKQLMFIAFGKRFEHKHFQLNSPTIELHGSFVKACQPNNVVNQEYFNWRKINVFFN